MKNPITQSSNQRTLYAIYWLVLGLLETLFLHFAQGATWPEAAIRAGFHVLAFGLLGLVIWYVVRFSGLEVRNIWNASVSHTAAALVLTGLWLLLTHMAAALVLGTPLSVVHLSTNAITGQLALGSLFYLLTALYYYLLIFYSNYQEKTLSELRMRSLLKESELSMLKAQLNPHFIFNSLNSISMLTLTRPEDAHEMIVKLSSFLRQTIGNSERELVALAKELETISLYLEIERMRFGDKLVVEFVGTEDVPATMKVPNLILQPLMENAIKYGVYEALEQSTITLAATHDNEVLQLEITNSTEAQPVRPPGKGIGLQNVRRRLEYLYERPGLLHTSLQGTQFTVTLTIPQNVVL